MSLDSIDTSVSEDSKGCSRTFSWDERETVTIAVVDVVTDLLGVEATELEPLNDVVDTDALNRLFAPTDDKFRRSGHVQFEYEGCLVRVQADGTVSAVNATQL